MNKCQLRHFHCLFLQCFIFSPSKYCQLFFCLAQLDLATERYCTREMSLKCSNFVLADETACSNAVGNKSAAARTRSKQTTAKKCIQTTEYYEIRIIWQPRFLEFISYK